MCTRACACAIACACELVLACPSVCAHKRACAPALEQGTLHMARDNALEGWVVLDPPPPGAAAAAAAAGGSGDGAGAGDGASGGGKHGKDQDSGLDRRDVLVSGRAALNRGMDMDRVVVEVLPRAQWRASRRLIVEDADDADDDDDEPAQPAAEPARAEDLRPTCRVVCASERGCEREGGRERASEQASKSGGGGGVAAVRSDATLERKYEAQALDEI